MRIVAVVLSYNNKTYLYDCLTAIVNQTRLPDLILFCDDGSTDGSVLLANEILSSSGLDFNLLRRPFNSGTLINFLSVTPYINPDDILVLCDVDDISYPSRFDVIFSRFSDSLLDGYGHAAEVIDASGRVVDKYYMQNGLLRLTSVSHDVFVYELHGACLAVRGDFILCLPAPTHRELFQDVFLAFFASVFEKRFLIEPIKLVSYRRHESANSNCATYKNYSGVLIDESKSSANSLRLYNLHSWLEWYLQASDLMCVRANIIISHFERSKSMHFIKYNFSRLGLIARIKVFAHVFLSKSPAWKWFLYRLLGVKFYFFLISIRVMYRATLNRIAIRLSRVD